MNAEALPGTAGLPDLTEEADLDAALEALLLVVDAPTDELEYVDLHVDRASLRAAAATLRSAVEDLDRDNLKDDIAGDEASGMMGIPDDDLDLVDDITDKPPGAGAGEDNAGNR